MGSNCSDHLHHTTAARFTATRQFLRPISNHAVRKEGGIFIAAQFVEDFTSNFLERTLFRLQLIVVFVALHSHGIIIGDELFQFDALQPGLLGGFVDDARGFRKFGAVILQFLLISSDLGLEVFSRFLTILDQRLAFRF